MKVVLSIAGSDSGGGAGIQADIKTFEAHGVFSATAVTALTAQNTLGVSGVFASSPEFVISQIRSVMDDFDVAAVKIGALLTKEIVDAVRAELAGYEGHIVLDPVCVSKAGSPLLEEGAEGALLELCERATVVTPNMTEAKKAIRLRDRKQRLSGDATQYRVSGTRKKPSDKKRGGGFLR